jgi:hypothetical protein
MLKNDVFWDVFFIVTTVKTSNLTTHVAVEWPLRSNSNCLHICYLGTAGHTVARLAVGA